MSTCPELFDEADAGDTEVELFWCDNAQFHEHSDPGDAVYIAARRKLLGPAADITHPEFGRPNRTEETFTISYRLTEQVQRANLLRGQLRNKKTGIVQVEERVLDHEGNLILKKDI